MSMDAQLRQELIGSHTDIEGALHRLSENEPLYLNCLAMFLEDPTAAELEGAIRGKKWEEAFAAAHALEGVAGNMGFIPLFDGAAKIVRLIRQGRIREVESTYQELQQWHQRIMRIIRAGLQNAKRSKGERT